MAKTMGAKPVSVKCPCKDKCFAKLNGNCSILTEAPKGNRCSFRKPDRDWTDGRYFPFVAIDAYGRKLK